MLNETQQERLLNIARQTMETYIRERKIPEFSEDDPQLSEPCGAFVTLHKEGNLRGCIGNIISQRPLYELIRDMAIASSTQDPRFPPVEVSEFSHIEIEISVLSQPQRVKDVAEIELGKHGVIVKRDFQEGVFLPQVATETGWSKEEFLSNLCAHKAGLSPEAWKEEATEIYIFSAQVFKEGKADGHPNY